MSIDFPTHVIQSNLGSCFLEKTHFNFWWPTVSFGTIFECCCSAVPFPILCKFLAVALFYEFLGCSLSSSGKSLIWISQFHFIPFVPFPGPGTPIKHQSLWGDGSSRNSLSCKIVKAALGTKILLKYLCKCKKRRKIYEAATTEKPLRSDSRTFPHFPIRFSTAVAAYLREKCWTNDFHNRFSCLPRQGLNGGWQGRGAWLGGTLVNLYQKRDTQKSGGGETPSPHPPTHPKSQRKAETNAMCVCWQYINMWPRTEESGKEVSGICKRPATFSIFPAFPAFP